MASAEEPNGPSPRRLLFVDDAPILGGAELLVLRLATWLATEHGDAWVPEIVCAPESALAARTLRAGIRTHPVTFPDLDPRHGFAMASSVRRLAGILRSAGRDEALVVATTARAQAYAAMTRLVAPGCAPVVNLLLEQETAARRSARAVLGRTGRLVAIGENTAQAYRTAIPGARVSLLNNVIGPGMLEGRTAERAAHAAGARPVLGYLGRLVPQKGALALVEEAAQVGDSWSSLVMVGDAEDPEFADRLRERIAELDLVDRVSVAGFVEDITDFFASIDALVVPSTGLEGQPTVIVEALAQKLPVIVRRHMWSADFDGLSVLPYTDPPSLAAAIEEARRLPAAEISELERRFGPEQALDALVAAGS